MLVQQGRHWRQGQSQATHAAPPLCLGPTAKQPLYTQLHHQELLMRSFEFSPSRPRVGTGLRVAGTSLFVSGTCLRGTHLLHAEVPHG